MRSRNFFYFILFLLINYGAHRSCLGSHELIPDEAYVRDGEIENILGGFLSQIKKALNYHDKVEIILKKTAAINAFATIANNNQAVLVFYSEMLLKTEGLDELVGVMAHEMSHIAFRHITGAMIAARQSFNLFLAGISLGLVGALVGGSGDLMAAGTAWGEAAASANIGQFSQAQESSADDNAIRVLQVLKWPISGFSKFMKKLEERTEPYIKDKSSYFATHPSPTNRRLMMQRAEKNNTGAQFSVEQIWQYNILIAKVRGIVLNVAEIKHLYPESEASDEALYAQAIAAYRESDNSIAIKKLQKLIEKHPKYPYFYEFCGYVNLKSQNLKEALKHYKKALDLSQASNNFLLKIDYAHVLICTENPANLKQAITLLLDALNNQPYSFFGWQLLIRAYGKIGEFGAMKLAQAEQYWYYENHVESLKFAKAARDVLKRKAQPDPVLLNRAEDLIFMNENKIKEE